MNCETYRELIATDPANLDQEAEAHAEGCVSCAAYGERVRSAEWLIHEAMRFDVATLKQRAAEQRDGGRGLTARRASWGVAAAVVVAGFAFWLNVDRGPEFEPEALVAEILGHWHEEPDSWQTTDVRVSPASLGQVILGSATVDSNNLGLISYARSCFVRDRWVPHLVVQGEQGPVMLLLLPHEQVPEPVPMDLPEEGLRGVIFPVGNGSVAVLGNDDEPMEPIADRISTSVEWSI